LPEGFTRPETLAQNRLKNTGDVKYAQNLGSRSNLFERIELKTQTLRWTGGSVSTPPRVYGTLHGFFMATIAWRFPHPSLRFGDPPSLTIHYFDMPRRHVGKLATQKVNQLTIE